MTCEDQTMTKTVKIDKKEVLERLQAARLRGAYRRHDGWVENIEVDGNVNMVRQR